MFGLSGQELLVIVVLALVILGPKRLPEVAKTLGKGYRELRKAVDGVKGTVNFNEAVSEILKGGAEREAVHPSDKKGKDPLRSEPDDSHEPRG